MIRQPNGYSGLFRRHASIEYVRFFIDWQDGLGFQSVGLAHHKVCDQPQAQADDERPRYRRFSIAFDRDRYWGCVMVGLRPKVRAVLSWHQVPELDPDFTPLFGNVIESFICDDSDDSLIEQIAGNPTGPAAGLRYEPCREAV